MPPLALTAYRVAKDLHVPALRINDIVRGKRAISADTALRLGSHFGLPAQFWLNLQNDYDLRHAKAAAGIAKNYTSTGSLNSRNSPPCWRVCMDSTDVFHNAVGS